MLLYDDEAQRYRVLPLETYVAGVVSAEMPAGFPPEALKAQAVAARTYAVSHLRARGGPGCPSHPPADVCSVASESQAWAPFVAAAGGPGGGPAAALAAARATRGQVAVYRGRPIDALYFAASGGRTEDARYVWGRPVPYLVSVPSPGERDPWEGATRRLTWTELARALGVPRAELLARPPARRFVVVRRTPSGRAYVVSVAGRPLAATLVRARLGLYSTWIAAVRADPEGVTIVTNGFGHGVGLSQYGAAAMAEAHATYADILRHYYPGVSLVPLSSLGAPLTSR
ncbi:MAG: SpoIID/LytB domain-containing protein [Clostridia bacterium]|nr:SpoIID/LytB domain-containing protein [Clostridia bacterium]